ncbi:hypothetical protein, partial [Lactobacillus mulieris]|uniref:hypothetical protein n=1 Tax=Lactobacillus mulieris TaxID=2508708 RepID=UPI0022ABC81A
SPKLVTVVSADGKLPSPLVFTSRVFGSTVSVLGRVTVTSTVFSPSPGIVITTGTFALSPGLRFLAVSSAPSPHLTLVPHLS